MNKTIDIGKQSGSNQMTVVIDIGKETGLHENPHFFFQIVEVHYGIELDNLSVSILVEDPASNSTSDCLHDVSFSSEVKSARYFMCNQTTFGRKLLIRTSAEVEFVLKLCEVKIYSQSVLSPQDACGPGNKGKIESLKVHAFTITSLSLNPYTHLRLIINISHGECRDNGLQF